MRRIIAHLMLKTRHVRLNLIMYAIAMPQRTTLRLVESKASFHMINKGEVRIGKILQLAQ